MQQESEQVRQDEEEGSPACQERKDQEKQAAKSDPYEMIYNTMEFEDMEKGDSVMKFGEHGTKFYIVLRGNVAVRVPSIVERDFTFQELLVLLVNDHEWIIQNDKYQEVMVLIQGIIPDLVFEDYRKNLQLDIDTTKRVLRGKIISYIQHNYPDGIPKFKDFNDFYTGSKFVKKGKDADTRYITLNFILEVVQLSVGASFGELALLEDKPRSATILCTENSKFAVLEKENFNKIMGKMYRSKFAKDIEFLSNFSFIQGLTRITKQKLCYPMVSCEYVRGQTIVSEGSHVKDIILLENGEYEMTKNIYIQKKNKVICEYFRIESDKDQSLIESLLDPDSMPLTFSFDRINKEIFNKRMQGFKKIEMRLSKNQRYECVGLVESVFDSGTLPSRYFTTVKCISKSGKARVIDKEELFRVVSRTKCEVLHTVRQKLSFIAQRMKFLLSSNKIELDPSYFENNGLSLSFTNPFKPRIIRSRRKDDSKPRNSEQEKSQVHERRKESQFRNRPTRVLHTKDVEEFIRNKRQKRMSVIDSSPMLKGLQGIEKYPVLWIREKRGDEEGDERETAGTKRNTKKDAYRHSATTHFKNDCAKDLSKEIDNISATLEEESQEDTSKGSWEASNSSTEMRSKYSNSSQNNPSSLPPSKTQNTQNSPKSSKNAQNLPKSSQNAENVKNVQNQPLLAPKSLLCLPSLTPFCQSTDRNLASQTENLLKSQTQPHEFPKIANTGFKNRWRRENQETNQKGSIYMSKKPWNPLKAQAKRSRMTKNMTQKSFKEAKQYHKNFSPQKKMKRHEIT
ncbi:unnamed protein product [Moneuplotes crassus]|uniref:Cyclic nucleotide-binding domain-containing protein n=1 Tax=Euplotes crassus TaxID=5936 RepID=A0AAD1Y6V9_EUPCR|nr:unnamed protein product [Moneuplotes crassus]